MGIDILVPVLGRPRNVTPLLESLEVTKEPHEVFFICSPGDLEQIASCQASGRETWIVDWHPGAADFAKKINWMFERTEAQWVFQAADDVRFYPGWDETALRVAKSRAKSVIGTNDLHNEAVKRGLQATHVLFRRDYIERHGGTQDNTGRVFCELYDHQYVDLEFCETAKRRGEWAFAKQSIVEHLHPHWGLAEDDETYRKAVRRSGPDRRLYQKRMGHTRASRYPRR